MEINVSMRICLGPNCLPVDRDKFYQVKSLRLTKPQNMKVKTNNLESKKTKVSPHQQIVKQNNLFSFVNYIKL